MATTISVIVAGLFIAAVLAIFVFAVVKVIELTQRVWRTFNNPDQNLPPRMDHLADPSPIRRTYVLRSPDPLPLPKEAQRIKMVRPSSRAFTFPEERHAATSHQRLWIKYEDFSGRETTREVDVYCPKEDDSYIFAWCRLKAEPRTFRRDKIIQWKFLDDSFEFNPLVERYFQEEGSRDRDDKIPWKRWLERQPRP